jgi:DNA methylase
MFPEQFAEKWIERLTLPGEYVLDPFSGRGTTALSAVLLGRRAISSDTNDVAYCLTLAKTNPPRYRAVGNRVRQLRDEYGEAGAVRFAEDLPLFFEWAFSRKTLRQLLFLRERLRWKSSKVDAMIAALVLGSLHGESQKSPTYLSNQMPRTISTKPDYSVRFWKTRDCHAPSRDVFDLVQNRIDYRYVSSVPKAHSVVFHADMRKLPYLLDPRSLPVRCVITSPPYLDVTNFEEDQWLRLWFLGGPPYPTRNRLTTDDRHTREDKY